MSLFFTYLLRQGSALVSIDDIPLMSNSKPCILQLIKQPHDIPNKKNLKLPTEKPFSMLLTVIQLGHESGFITIKPIQFKLMLQFIKFLPRLQILN